MITGELTPEQEKRFDALVYSDAETRGMEIWTVRPDVVKKFFAQELQLERDRVIRAFKESANIMFREHDMKPATA